MSSKQSLTITQALEDEPSRVIFWRSSTDIIIPPNSSHAHKGTARHILLGSVWELVGSQCPRCDGEWNHSSDDGLTSCSTRGCHTSKEQMNIKDKFASLVGLDPLAQYYAIDYHDAWKPFEEFVATEEGAELYKKAMSDTLRANQSVNIPPAESNVMSEPREEEVFDEEIPIFEDEEIPYHIPATMSGETKQEEI